ncbi:hypothetical protein [Acinetobacter stercoris]|uniref:Phage antitermination protein Q n=1 Tax=Acinetobacter stercoris TaxID=2126983 RepID=A0A2U3N3Q7_9GAMM|nr:hypothetical protein [Acinetobacter stercoris]SPL72292.1 hypothetical protein KPC_3470 [Acinetobacter stercoris]
MSAVAIEKHILQTTDWSRFDLEGWLYQFGAWQYSNTGPCGQPVHPIAIGMDQAAKAMRLKRLGKKKQRKIIADYFMDEMEPMYVHKPKVSLQINDNEARAIQRLVLDLQGQSDVLDEWLDAVISRYFYNNSWAEMVNDVRTQMDARFDVKCGLAVLHVRYGWIGYMS